MNEKEKMEFDLQHNFSIVRQELKEKYEKMMSEIAKDYDTDGAHHDADDCLCKLLTEIGFEELVKLYKGVRKWYS